MHIHKDNLVKLNSQEAKATTETGKNKKNQLKPQAQALWTTTMIVTCWIPLESLEQVLIEAYVIEGLSPSPYVK